VTDEFPLNRDDEERYLVGLLLPTTMRTLRDDALTKVAAEHFGSGIYGGMWAAALRLRALEEPINRRTLLAETKGWAGGTLVEQTLDGLDGYVPWALDYPRVLSEVITTGKLRQLVAACDRGKQRAMTAEDFGDAYSVVLEELEKLAEQDEDAGIVKLGDAMTRLEERYKRGLGDRAIASPWHEFNERAAGGFHRGRLYVVGGRPGDGKSIVGHQAALHAAGRHHQALIVSMEISLDEVSDRLLANGTREPDERGQLGAGIDMGEVTTMNLTQDSWLRYHKFTARSRDWPLWIDDRAGQTIESITSTCRLMKRRQGLDLLCVDYLQLLNLRGVQSREQQVSELARRFKNLARELDCAVLLPCQLNRNSVHRGKPSLADLRESGGIEAHADLVVLLARQVFPEDHRMAGLPDGTIALDIAKNRFGPTGSILLPWRGCYASIG
jgi:replicative DNA helicase